MYVAFGHLPATVEDGFVVDSTFTKYGPRLLLNTHLNLRIMSEKNSMTNKEIQSCGLLYHAVNKKINDTIFFGTLTSKKPIKLLQNKKIKISHTKRMGGIYQYDMTCKIEHDSFEEYTIASRSHFKHSAPSIILKYTYRVPIGVGTKLCNLYGQKGEIAQVRDLSEYVGVRADGVVVKAQVTI